MECYHGDGQPSETIDSNLPKILFLNHQAPFFNPRPWLIGGLTVKFDWQFTLFCICWCCCCWWHVFGVVDFPMGTFLYRSCFFSSFLIFSLPEYLLLVVSPPPPASQYYHAVCPIALLNVACPACSNYSSICSTKAWNKSRTWCLCFNNSKYSHCFRS